MASNSSGAEGKKRAHSPSDVFRSEAPDSPSSSTSPKARRARRAKAAQKRDMPAPHVLEDEFESSSSSGSDSELEITEEKILLCLNNAYDHFQNDWELSNAYVWIPEFIFKSPEVGGSRKSTPDQQDGGSYTSDIASIAATPSSHRESPPSWMTTLSSRPGSPEARAKRLSVVHTEYRKNCITPLIEWATKKYKLCWKGCTNQTKQRESVEQIIRLVRMSYESNNPDRLWEPPTATLSACAFFNVWADDDSGSKFRPASDTHERPEILGYHVGFDMEDNPNGEKELMKDEPNEKELMKLVPVSFIVSELKLRYPPDNMDPLTPNEKARMICLIKDPLLAVAFRELHGHFSHRSQLDDKNITCMDVITRRFNDTNVKCMTNYTALSNIDPEVCKALTSTVKVS
jgi:hypothetical protein